jgi:hypothetical protein
MFALRNGEGGRSDCFRWPVEVEAVGAAVFLGDIVVGNVFCWQVV